MDTKTIQAVLVTVAILISTACVWVTHLNADEFDVKSAEVLRLSLDESVLNDGVDYRKVIVAGTPPPLCPCGIPPDPDPKVGCCYEHISYAYCFNCTDYEDILCNTTTECGSVCPLYVTGICVGCCGKVPITVFDPRCQRNFYDQCACTYMYSGMGTIDGCI